MNTNKNPTKAITELKLSANARQVLAARYLQRDGEGQLSETPEQLFSRVADAVAAAEVLLNNDSGFTHWRDVFHRMLTSLEFLPNSPTLMNAGTTVGQLSACFVLPVTDTKEDISDTVKQITPIQRTGGGTGFAFSHLRPRGEVVAATGEVASSPVSFMKIFDQLTETIKQGGRRRGANMGVLQVDHPDILEFIAAKRDQHLLQNFNLSVGVTDSFMAALRQDHPFPLHHPVTGHVVDTLPARKIFDEMVESAWQTGDPGLLFLDAINRANPTPQLGVIEATNPCGEVPLLPYESCNLGSINLPRMLDHQNGSTTMDWVKLAITVHHAVRFLDNVIEVNHYPVPPIADISRANRKLGLGVMGFAEALIRLGLAYDSPEAVVFAERLMGFISEESRRASESLAVERGVFANWIGSACAARGERVRNATRTAIAPAGTIGIIADTTPSIEPLFALAYRRVNVLDGQTLFEVNPLFRDWLMQHGVGAEGLLSQIERSGHLSNLPGVPAEARRLFVTALEIPPEQHLQIQAAFQRHTDNSVSKTINLPHNATREDVAHIFQRAHELNLKGVTVYRYGSKTSQVLKLGAEENPAPLDYARHCEPEECRI